MILVADGSKTGVLVAEDAVENRILVEFAAYAVDLVIVVGIAEMDFVGGNAYDGTWWFFF